MDFQLTRRKVQSKRTGNLLPAYRKITVSGEPGGPYMTLGACYEAARDANETARFFRSDGRRL